MKKIRELGLLLFLFSSQVALASGTVIKPIDTIQNTTGGSALSVPSGTTLLSDTSTATLTNKSISGSTNTITNVSLTTGVTGILPVANGGAPVPAQEFPAAQCNGSNTSFVLLNTPSSAASVLPHLDGILLTSADYTISGTTITLTVACATGQKLYVVYTH